MIFDLLPPRALLDFLLHDWLAVDQEGTDRETGLALLDAAHDLAVGAFLPSYREGDLVEPRLDETGVHIAPGIVSALHQFAELGFFGASFPEALGGMGLSAILTSAVCRPPSWPPTRPLRATPC